MKLVRLFVFAALLLFMTISAWAYDFEVDGICYNVISSTDVEVTSGGIYLGHIAIPASVNYNEINYSVIKIGKRAFYLEYDLTSVLIPNSVTIIENSAFYGCSGLTSIDIPNSVTSIGVGAFSYCSRLLSITIPDSVTHLGNYVLNNCGGLNSIIVDSGNPVYDSRNNCNAIIEKETNKMIAGCNATVIPNSVRCIGNGIFSSCVGLVSITIPNSVMIIEDCAFSNCSGLSSITIPNSVNSIGDCVFSGCSGLSSIIVATNNPVYDSRNNCNAIIETETNKMIAGCNMTIIPNSVTNIGDGVFVDCTGLSSVIIPNSVTTIGNDAFRGCSELISVSIPNSVTSIGSWAFAWCYKLASFSNSNSLTNIGDGAFYECSEMTSIDIPDSVTSIGFSAFYGCSRLTSINIPNSLSSIERTTFSHCSGLTLISIPNSVTSIEYGAFSYCSGISSICLPVSVTSVAPSTFAFCSELTTVTLGKHMTHVGENAFYGCDGLVSLIVMVPTPPTIENNSFPNTSNITLNIPCNSLESYQSDEYWSCFTNIIENISLFNLEVLSSDESLGSVLVTSRPDCVNKVATVVAEPIGDHPFLNWTANGQVVSTANPYTFVVEGDIELVANFYGTGVNEETEQKVTVSPNPTKGFVNIECENMKDIAICSLDGRVVKTYSELNTNAFTLDMTGLSKGIYILHIKLMNETIINKKIIKE